MDINELLNLSVKQHASDLHILPGAPPMLRIDGELVSVKEYPVLDADMTKKLIFSIMNKEQQELFHSQLEIDFTLATAEASAGFRANAFHQADGIAAVFRVIPH